MKRRVTAGVAALTMAATAITIQGSSHREAPGITKTPKVDGTDFYMFRSFEPGRAEYVTLLANYLPLQDVYGGPNFFMLDEDAVYEIHVDNNGDAVEDITFQLQFQNLRKDLAVPVGDRMVAVPLINIGGIGPAAGDTANLNVEESYTLRVVRGPRRTGTAQSVTNAATGETRFRKPVDRIGDKSIRDNNPFVYNDYANNHIYDVDIPGCGAEGRVFVGQRREGFVVNLAETFDLINTNPLGPENGETNDLADKNVTTIALEVPISCLTAGDPVIGAWTTASIGKGTPPSGGTPSGETPAAACPAGQPSGPKPASNWVPTQDCQGWVPPGHPNARSGGSGSASTTSSTATTCAPGQPSGPKPALDWVPTADCQGWVPPGHPAASGAAPGGGSSGTPPGLFTQVSRLGHPLVNEVVIGLKDKDTFNGSEPTGDGQFLEYVTHPTLPILIQALFGVPPPAAPRNDLVTVFLTGVPGLNQPMNVTPAEILRLNTSIAPVAPASQHRLGVIGGDNAGFPNGRRPGDDVVDIALRVMEGILLAADASTFPALTDGAFSSATVAYDPDGTVTGDTTLRLFRDTFPYLSTPLSGSPNPTHQ
jgi:hypothetical protein